ncbi:MAG: hypothetical protein WAV74_06210 [Anaerolineae bacterium]
MDIDLTYQTALRSLAARFRWGLLTESAWIEAAMLINPNPEDDKAARRACLTVYSRTLYEACQERRRQDRAYRELFDYLYPQAHARDAELACEAAQDAIVLVYRSFAEPKLKKCQQPDAFLFFAQGKLRDAFKRLYLEWKRKNNAIPLGQSSDDDDQGDGHWSLDPADLRTPESELLEDEREQWIKVMVHHVAERVLRCLQTLWEVQRLRAQTRTLLLTFMDRATDEQIAIQLRRTKGAIQSLRKHALDTLRACLDMHLPLSFGGEL